MPIVGTNLISGNGNHAGPTFTTASISPSANALVLLTIIGSSGPLTNPSAVSGAGLTWVNVQNINDGSARHCSVWRGMSSSPSSGALTITWTNAVWALWSVNEFSPVDTSGTNGSGAIGQTATAQQSSTSTGISVAVTNNLSKQSNALHGTGRFGALTTITKDAGFTELVNFQDPHITLENQYKLSTKTATWSWSSQALLVIICIQEIVAPYTFIPNPNPDLPDWW